MSFLEGGGVGNNAFYVWIFLIKNSTFNTFQGNYKGTSLQFNFSICNYSNELVYKMLLLITKEFEQILKKYYMQYLYS